MTTLNPPTPENVRVEMEDGRVIPVELRYLGKRGGQHLWEAVTVIGQPDGCGGTLLIGRLPRRTTITLLFQEVEA